MSGRPVHRTRPFHGGRDRASATAEELIREAHLILENAGVHMSHTKVVRIVRTYLARVASSGFPFVDFVCNHLDAGQRARVYTSDHVGASDGFDAWLQHRFDPTPAAALRNVEQVS